MRVALLLVLLGGCVSMERATMIRNIGIGVTVEGGLVTGGAFVTRDSDQGISDAVITASPLLATGIALWIAGEILRGTAEPTK